MIYSSNPTLKDLKRDLDPYETNKKCLKSIKFHYKKNKGKRSSHFFKSIGRDKGNNIFKIKKNDYVGDELVDLEVLNKTTLD